MNNAYPKVFSTPIKIVYCRCSLYLDWDFREYNLLSVKLCTRCFALNFRRTSIPSKTQRLVYYGYLLERPKYRADMLSRFLHFTANETNPIGRTVYDRRRNVGRDHCGRTNENNRRIWRNRQPNITGRLSVR